LAGSCLVLDQKIKDDGVVLCDMVEGEHFIFNVEDGQERFLVETLKQKDKIEYITEQSFKLGKECFVDNNLLSLEERFWRVYLLNPNASIYSYDDLKAEEQRLNLENKV